MLAALLASQGHLVCVIERHAQLYPLPRAFRFDGEVMRILQRLGIVDELDLLAFVTDDLSGAVVSLDPSVSRAARDADGALTTWMRDSGVGVVLIRPDAYIFGSARHPAAAGALVEALRRAMTAAPRLRRAA